MEPVASNTFQKNSALIMNRTLPFSGEWVEPVTL